MTTIDRDQIKARIKKAVETAGGAAKFARSLDVTTEYVQHIMNGKRPGPKTLRAIGVVETGGIYRELNKGK